MESCYDCRHLVQLGIGGNICIRFDLDGQDGTWRDDDRPEPLYPDCCEPIQWDAGT